MDIDTTEWPDWAQSVIDNYRRHTVQWMWVSMTLLVALIIGVLLLPRHLSRNEEASELMTKGFDDLSNDQFLKALWYFDRILEMYSGTDFADEARICRAASLFGLGQHDKAEADYRLFLEKYPQHELAAQASAGVAACLEMKGDTAASLAEYRRAREKYPESFMAHAIDLQIARLSQMAGETTAAQAIYDRFESDSESLWRELSRGRRRVLPAVNEVSDTAAA